MLSPFAPEVRSRLCAALSPVLVNAYRHLSSSASPLDVSFLAGISDTPSTPPPPSAPCSPSSSPAPPPPTPPPFHSTASPRPPQPTLLQNLLHTSHSPSRPSCQLPTLCNQPPLTNHLAIPLYPKPQSLPHRPPHTLSSHNLPHHTHPAPSRHPARSLSTAATPEPKLMPTQPHSQPPRDDELSPTQHQLLEQRRPRRNPNQADPAALQARMQELEAALQAELGPLHKPLAAPSATGAHKLITFKQPLRERVAELCKQVPPETVAKLLQGTPELLLLEPSLLLPRLRLWADAFGMSEQEAVEHLSGRGSGWALDAVRENIKQRVETLVAVSGLSTVEVLARCLKDVRLLTISQDTMLARAKELGERLGSGAAAQLLKKAPSVLLSKPILAQKSAEGLYEALEGEVTWEEAVELCWRQSPLAGQRKEKLLQGARWLRERLGLSQQRLKKLDVLVLLIMPVETLEARLAALPAALAIPEEEALRLASNNPRILSIATRKVAAGWMELKHVVRLRPEWCQQVEGWSENCLVLYCRTPLARRQERLQAVLQLGPALQQVPALSSMTRISDTAFQGVITRLQRGTFRCKPGNRLEAEDTLFFRYPRLCAQLRTDP